MVDLAAFVSFFLFLFLFARVCFFLPVFVYVLGGFGNKRGRGEDVRAAIRASDVDERQSEEVSAAIRASDNDAIYSTRRGVNLAKIRKEFLTILITC